MYWSVFDFDSIFLSIKNLQVLSHLIRELSFFEQYPNVASKQKPSQPQVPGRKLLGHQETNVS